MSKAYKMNEDGEFKEVEKIKNPLDQEWRKRDPIIMQDGKVVQQVKKVDIKYDNDIKSNFITELKLMTKIIRGLYTGTYQKDKEYIRFCDKTMDNLIEEKGNSMSKHYKKTLESTIRNNCFVIPKEKPETKPVQLCSNTIKDEFLKIDLDKNLTDKDKMIQKEILVNKLDPGEPIELSLTNSKRSGKALLQSFKNGISIDLEDSEPIKDRNKKEYSCISDHVNVEKIAEKIAKKIKKKTTKKKVAKKKNDK
jgi:hypothetical protein